MSVFVERYTFDKEWGTMTDLSSYKPTHHTTSCHLRNNLDASLTIPQVPLKLAPCVDSIAGIWRYSLALVREDSAMDRGNGSFSNYLEDRGTETFKDLKKEASGVPKEHLERFRHCCCKLA